MVKVFALSNKEAACDNFLMHVSSAVLNRVHEFLICEHIGHDSRSLQKEQEIERYNRQGDQLTESVASQANLIEDEKKNLQTLEQQVRLEKILQNFFYIFFLFFLISLKIFIMDLFFQINEIHTHD